MAKIAGLDGEVSLTENLGFPALPTNIDPSASSVTQYLSGTHPFHVWAADNGNVRLQVPSGTEETDLTRNGQNVWLWDSGDQAVTRYSLPSKPTDSNNANEQEPTTAAMTPQAMADRFLNMVSPTTDASISGTTRVAKHDAYVLQIIPKSTTSLVGSVRIAVDAVNYTPLDVQIFARGATKAAVEVGYSSVNFSNPNPSVFVFKPPAGAKVTNEALLGGSGRQKPAGTVADQMVMPSVVGTGWDSVVIIPAQDTHVTSSSSVSEPRLHKGSGRHHRINQGDQGSQPTGESLASSLAKYSTPVSGAFGSGELVHTSLVNVVVLSDGRVAIGATNQRSLLAAIPHN